MWLHAFGKQQISDDHTAGHFFLNKRGFLSTVPVLSPIGDGRYDNSSPQEIWIAWLPICKRKMNEFRLGSSVGLLKLGTLMHHDFDFSAYSIVADTKTCTVRVSPTPFIKAKRQESLSV